MDLGAGTADGAWCDVGPLGFSPRPHPVQQGPQWSLPGRVLIISGGPRSRGASSISSSSMAAPVKVILVDDVDVVEGLAAPVEAMVALVGDVEGLDGPVATTLVDVSCTREEMHI